MEKEFYYPKKLSEALDILAENKTSLLNIPVAGSTGIIFSKKPNIKGFIDINRMGLDYIKKVDNNILIGAACTANKIAHSELISSLSSGLLSKSAGSIGSRLIRNSCTIGGNLADLKIWSDLPVALLVLDAKVLIMSRDKSRTMSIDQFLGTHPSRILSPSELITEIIIPLPPQGARGTFIKFNRTSTDYTLLDMAVYMELDSHKIRNPRIAISAVTNLPLRMKNIENLIDGKVLDDKLLRDVSREAIDTINPLPTYKVSAEYRKYLVGIILGRAIEECVTV